MSKVWFVLLGVALLIGTFAGCSKVGANQNYINPAETINAGIGAIFTIQLKSNPTTGYDWEYASTNGAVQLLEKTYEADNTGVIGSGGTDSFKFKVEGKGNTSLIFNYRRPWESTSIDQKVFSLVVS
jgi:inhibitor of cysteine peptidase